MDTARLAKILDIAGHPETDENTARNAVRRARDMLSKEKLSFAEFVQRAAAPKVQVNLSYGEWRERVEKLEGEARLKDAKVASLQKEVADLSDKLQKTDALARTRIRVNDDGSSTFTEWAKYAFSKVGCIDNWQTAILLQTTITHADLLKWRSTNVVPKAGVEFLASLKPPQADPKPKPAEASEPVPAPAEKAARGMGDTSKKAMILEAIRQAGNAGIRYDQIDGNVRRRVAELERAGKVHKRDAIWYYGRAPGWVPRLHRGEREILEMLKSAPGGLTTSALESRITGIQAQERLREVKAAGYVERGVLGNYELTLLGEEALALA